MIAFRVDDMTCGPCAGTITKALKSADENARVVVDLARHLVMIEPAEADPNALRHAIAQAGYAPTPVGAEAGKAATTAQGCGCGCCR